MPLLVDIVHGAGTERILDSHAKGDDHHMHEGGPDTEGDDLLEGMDHGLGLGLQKQPKPKADKGPLARTLTTSM